MSHVDFAVGSQAATAILAALHHRHVTGEGQHIDVSMAETMLATNEFAAIEINGGFGEEISPFRPGKAALLKLVDGTWVQVPYSEELLFQVPWSDVWGEAMRQVGVNPKAFVASQQVYLN